MELLNDSSGTLSLDGWRLATADGNVTVSLSGAIPAGGYYLLERSSDTTVGGLAADKIYTGALSNSGADLTLLDASSAAVDSAHFAGGWPAGSASPSYQSMERVSPEADGNSTANWKSNDGATRNGTDAKGASLNGTPKARNSVWSASTSTATAGGAPQPSTPTVSVAAVREVVINEIAWAGTAASPFHEWMELLNNSTRTIVLDGWRLRSSDGDLDIALGGPLESGDYYLLERTSDSPVGDIKTDKIYSGSLSNSGADLTLLDASSSAVDSARFAAGGWPAGSSAPSYSSMERVTPSADGDLAANWKFNDGATRNGTDAKGTPLNGTPKARNSVFSPVLPLPPAPDSAAVPSATEERALSIDRATNPFSPRDPNPARRAARFVVNAGTAGATRTVRVCDVRGQVVRTFSDSDISSGAIGALLWDGKDDGGRLLPPGIYLVHLDAASPSGERKTGRATVVLGYPK